MKFMIDGGAGKLNGNLAGTWIRVNKGEFTFPYVPTTAGNHRISYTVRNTAGTEVTKSLDITIFQPDFNFSGSLVKKSTTINDPIKFNFNVEAIGDDLGSNYKMNFTSSKSATLNGQEPNVWFDVQKGNQSFIINPTEIGDNDITINVKNDYGVQKTINLRLTVINYSFSFTAVTTGTTALLNKTIPVSFNISPIGNDAGQSYQIKYIVEEGKADIESFTTAGIYKDTSKGEFLLNVTPKTLGNLRIRFFVKNTAGTIQEQVVSLVSSLPEFSFTATPQKTTLLTGEVIPVNTQLLAIDDDADQNYEFMFVTPTGNAEIAGYEKGVWKSISKGVFPLNIKFLNVGVNEVVMKVRNTSGNEKTQTISVEAVKTDIQINSLTTSVSSIMAGAPTNLIINITKTPKNSDFVKYRIWLSDITEGSVSGLSSTNGSYVEGHISDGRLEYALNPSESGTYKVNVQLMDEYGSESAVESIPVTVTPEVTLTTPISGKIKIDRRRNSGHHNEYFEFFTGYEFKYALSSKYDIESITYDFSFVSDAMTFRRSEKLSGSKIPNKRNVDFSINPSSASTYEEYWNGRVGRDGGKFLRDARWSDGQLTISVLLSNGKTYKFKGNLNIIDVSN